MSREKHDFSPAEEVTMDWDAFLARLSKKPEIGASEHKNALARLMAGEGSGGAFAKPLRPDATAAGLTPDKDE